MGAVDLLIRGGEICTPAGRVQADLAVDGGKIVAIMRDGGLLSADRTVDAAGKFVLPGVIDSHAHFRDPGYTYKEDFETGTKAAAAGGVTFVCDMPNTKPVPNTAELYNEHVRIVENKAVVDYNRWASPTVFEEIGKIARLGAIGFKVFMKGPINEPYPYVRETYIGDDYVLLQTFKEIRKTGLPVALHPWNMSVWPHIIENYTKAGKVGHDDYLDAIFEEDAVIYTSGVAKLLDFQRISGVKMHVCHVNFRPVFNLIRWAKAQGLDVTSEFNVWQALPYATEKGLEVDPRAGYPWHYKQDVKKVWEALNDGTIDLIATDHSPHTQEEMTKPGGGFEAPGGAPCIQEYIPLLMTEVNNGRITLERLTALCSENVAKHLNIYPRKGAAGIGSDADLTIVDMEKEMTITAEKAYTKCKLTPYEGRKVKGVPAATIVRGAVVMEDGEVVGKPGYGRFIPPSVS